MYTVTFTVIQRANVEWKRESVYCEVFQLVYIFDVEGVGVLFKRFHAIVIEIVGYLKEYFGEEHEYVYLDVHQSTIESHVFNYDLNKKYKNSKCLP